MWSLCSQEVVEQIVASCFLAGYYYFSCTDPGCAVVDLQRMNVTMCSSFIALNQVFIETSLINCNLENGALIVSVSFSVVLRTEDR